jgi:vesicle coat complex subunit
MKGTSFGNAKTCQVGFFENRADDVYPPLSTLMTDALKDKIQSSSRLRLVNSNADVAFEGVITGYSVTSGQVTAQGVASKDRLTITVKVKFTNELDSDKSYDKSFSRFQEFAGGTSVRSVEGSLVDDILKEILEDIFNEAFASW